MTFPFVSFPSFHRNLFLSSTFFVFILPIYLCIVPSPYLNIFVESYLYTFYDGMSFPFTPRLLVD